VTAAATSLARPTLLVWIDAEEALLVRWDGDAHVDRLVSDVPPRREATGHVRHDPSVRHGGGGAAQDKIERDRDGHLRAFVAAVAATVDPGEDVEIVGPGTVRTELARLIVAEDRRQGRDRSVIVEAARPMTERQLVARLRERIGDPAMRIHPRRTA
jgi:hypothetical protein